jgi:apolipoprotein N-acyltransferase
VKLKPSDGLALVAGAIMTRAFAPYDSLSASFISLTILFVLWDRFPRRIIWQSWLYGVGLFATGTYWMVISIHEFAHVVLWLAVLLTCLFVCCMALFVALFGWIAGKRSSNEGWNFLFFYPVIWVAMEWCKGWMFTGFPWLTVGYSHLTTLLSGYAPVLGVYGVSLVFALTVGAIALIVNRQDADKRAISMLVVIWGGAVALSPISWTQESDETMQVSMVQGNISQDQKWLPEQQWPTLKMYRDYTLKEWQSDLIIWPETAIPAIYHQVESTYLTKLEKQAKDNQSVVIAGLPLIKSEKYYNGLVAIGDESRQFYDKIHLVPFGEYMPFPSILSPLLEVLSIPMSDFRSGQNNQPLIDVKGISLAMTICYEDVFGEEMIKMLPEADVLVNLSNDAWFGDSLAPHQHLQMAQMRALETGRYLLRSTNTGITAIINPYGHIEKQMEQFKQGVLQGKVTVMSGTTPYVLVGNWAVVGFMSLILLFHFVRRSKSSAHLDTPQ